LLAERYGTDAPISGLARALGIHFYNHDFLESLQLKKAMPAGLAIARVSFADSFVASIPEALREVMVDTVLVLYNADFSHRPRDLAHRRLRFFGAYSYAARSG
jgi:hypothetical protein